MIKFENGMLVLNNAFSKDDVNQINEFADSIRKEERERATRLLQDPYWHNLRSPGIHEDCKMCETIWLMNDVNVL
jgi:hypothetical protein